MCCPENDDFILPTSCGYNATTREEYCTDCPEKCPEVDDYDYYSNDYDENEILVECKPRTTCMSVNECGAEGMGQSSMCLCLCVSRTMDYQVIC